jgi:hypothetical protein
MYNKRRWGVASAGIVGRCPVPRTQQLDAFVRMPLWWFYVFFIFSWRL